MKRGELHQTDRPELITDHQVMESEWSEEAKMHTLERSSKRTFYLEEWKGAQSYFWLVPATQ